MDVAFYRAGIKGEQSKALMADLVLRGLVVTLNERVAIGQQELKALGQRALLILDSFHSKEPLEQGMRREELRTRLLPRANLQLSDLVIDRLREGQWIDVRDGLVARHGFQVVLSDEQLDAVRELEKLYLTAGYTPPSPDEIKLHTGVNVKVEQLLSLLINQGTLIRLTPSILMHRDHVEEAWRIVRESIKGQGHITLAEFRDKLDASRKFAIALLEYFDKLKRTRLTDDLRVFHPQYEA